MTFSIVGYDPNTGDLGVAVQSKFLCVGAIVPWARADIGAIATQGGADHSYGLKGLSLLESGLSPNQVIAKLVKQGQVGIIDSKGNPAAYTGKDCPAWAGHLVGEHYSCQGNVLISEETVEGMASGFEQESGDLPEKLIAALQAADREGRGDARGKQSACLYIVRKKGGYRGYTDNFVDIRIDDHPEPIKELQRVFELYDMTFLTREPPENLLKIEGKIASDIKRILTELGYLDLNKITLNEEWGEVEHKAFEWWMSFNNFENKWRDDGMVWKSIYEHIMREK
ncbi:MAG: DUF1028 domain-containing protein [Candidatus Hodarchaeota archaeon]